MVCILLFVEFYASSGERRGAAGSDTPADTASRTAAATAGATPGSKTDGTM
jgi:hypothetical protein